jgi:hypothetical protein
MTTRTALVSRLSSIVGPAITLQGLGTGWPSQAELDIEGDSMPVAIFASPIGLSHRRRDDIERRFQNPAGNVPLIEQPGRKSLLIGLWEHDDHVTVPSSVIALADAKRRAGRTTRWSVFVPLAALEEAADAGWSAHTSDSGERILCFRPELLPLAVVAANARVDPDESVVQKSVRATGCFEPSAGSLSAEDSRDRLRRVVSVLIRDARFSGTVLDAYGRRCAMRGLGLSLIQGAHVYPAAAPGSNDDVTNGIALCATHHLAFDRHQIAVLRDTLQIVFRPDVLDNAKTDLAARSFVEGTFSAIRTPNAGVRPDPQMLKRRYEHFVDDYVWLKSGAYQS